MNQQRRGARPAQEPAHDEINHPAHYNSHPSGTEAIDVCEHLTFCVGNAVKYCWRAGLKVEENEDEKQARVRDLRKAIWYLNREVERLEREDGK